MLKFISWNDSLDVAGRETIGRRRFVKYLMTAITLVAAFVTISRGVVDLSGSPNAGPLLDRVFVWLTSQFSVISLALLTATTSLFALTWYLKAMNLEDIRELLLEREQEVTRQAEQLEASRIRLSNFSNLEETSQQRVGSWRSAFREFLAVHGVSRHTLFKSVHDLSKSRLTNPDDQANVAANVCRTTLAEIERTMSALSGLEIGKVLCSVKILNEDGFDCMYAVTNEDDYVLESKYGRAPIEGSLPASILESGRELSEFSIDHTSTMVPEGEKELFEDLEITGLAACPIRIHEEFNQSPRSIGVFCVFLRHDAQPYDQELFLSLTRLFSEHIADLYQFGRTMVRHSRRSVDGQESTRRVD